MDKSEIRTNRVNADDKPLKGLVNKGYKTFKCTGCNKPLLALQLTAIEGESVVEVLTRIAVLCCACKSFSCVQQISGQFHPGAPNDQMAFDVLDDDTGAPEADVLFKAWSK
ncbi:hypothetical protein LCGC14_0221470 [marine sediment metagenome]|uniref:Uncharacterized protein n=1 Tax=marine sediment metagenome TaxID=412755 RepID=A0A0F9UI22_9ZZZZ